MKQTTVLLVAVAVFLATAVRLPAPIQEVPESPSPTPALPAAAQPKANVPAITPQPEATKTRINAKEKSANVLPSTMPAPNRTNQSSSNDGNVIPKGAVHLVAHTDSDFRKIFTYFQFPGVVAAPGTTGLYRIEVSPDGTVAAITILKSMGQGQDVAFMKAFARWKAVPGPLRVVDVPRRIFTYYHVTH